MIDRKLLVSDLRKQVKYLEEDLRERAASEQPRPPKAIRGRRSTHQPATAARPSGA